jgi:alpha-tubulin suppressor-like RCC1 family protein
VDRLKPRAVGNPVTDLYAGVTTGADHTCATRITEPWSLWCWGRNHRGQLGTGGTSSTNVPTVVPAPTGEYWRVVRTQDSHTCGLTNPSGTNWCWGWKAFGQLGNGTTTGSPSPIRLSISNWRVFTGMAHTCAIEVDATLWCWGKNSNGQLGLGDTANRTVPTQIRPAPPTHP